MELRPATSLRDAQALFVWRNDPTTRENSLNSDPVEWDSHYKWFNASVANPDRDLLVAWIGDEPVGTVRIDRGDETEISWTVAPKHRGKGIAKQMVAAALPGEPVVARIKPGNIASQKIAQATGFKLTSRSAVQTWTRDPAASHTAVIDQIEAIRGRNNKNWMDLLRLAFKHAPDEAAEIMAGIYEQDAEISALVRHLTR